MSSLSELRERRDALEVELHQVRTEIRRIEVEDAPFHVGDVVESLKPGTGQWREAIVRSVKPQGFSIWYTVSFRKVNGEWADQVRHAYSSVRAVGSTETPR